MTLPASSALVCLSCQGRRVAVRLVRVLLAATLAAAGSVMALEEAAVATPLSCAPGAVYAVQGASPHNLYSVDTSSGALTSVGQLSGSGTLNAQAISADGRYVYAFNGSEVFRYDSLTETTTSFAGEVGVAATHGAINPVTGFYYYGGLADGATVRVYGFDTTTNTSIGQVGSGNVPTTGGNGDWAFDTQGRLYVVGGAGTSDALVVLDQTLPTEPGSIRVSGHLLANITASGNPINAMAFGGDALYLGNGTSIFRVDPSTGDVTDTVAQSPSGVTVDFASCSTPSTILVRKDFVSHFSADDQVTVRVRGGGLTAGNTGTTTGSANGLHSEAAEVAGPVVGHAGTTYTVSEEAVSGADLSTYDTSWACVDAANGNAPVANGVGTSGTVVMPAEGATGIAVVCTFTNTAKKVSLRFDKVASTPVDVNGSRIVDSGDTIAYSFIVTNDGEVPVHGIVIEDPKVGDVTCEAVTLAPGDATTCTAPPYVVTEADVAAGTVENTASVTGLDPVGGTVRSNEDSTATPTSAIPSPDLVIEATAEKPVDVNGSGLTDAGDTIAYSYTVWNLGTVAATDLVIDDAAAGPATCDRTTLAPDESTDCFADNDHVVTELDETAGSVDTSARARATGPDGVEATSGEDATSTPTTVPRPLLTFGKRSGSVVDANGSGAADAGDTIAYRFVLGNGGNVPLHAISVSDPKVGLVTCPRTTLAVDTSVTCQATFKLGSADAQSDSVVNTAHASAQDPDQGVVVSNDDTTTTTVEHPGLRVRTRVRLSGDGDGKADAGERIRYSFKVTNTGNVLVRGVAISATKARSVSCALTRLEPGESTRCTAPGTYLVRQADIDRGVVVSKARASGRTPGLLSVRSKPDIRTTPVDAS